MVSPWMPKRYDAYPRQGGVDGKEDGLNSPLPRSVVQSRDRSSFGRSPIRRRKMKIVKVGLTAALLCLAGPTVSRSETAGKPVTTETREVPDITERKTTGADRAVEIETIARENGVTLSELNIEYDRSSTGPVVVITVRGTASSMPALTNFREELTAIKGIALRNHTFKQLAEGEFGCFLMAEFAGEAPNSAEMKASGSDRAVEIETIARENGVTLSKLNIEYRQNGHFSLRSITGPVVVITVQGTASSMPALTNFREELTAIKGLALRNHTFKQLADGEFGCFLIAVAAL